jgi:hypothetical protein
MEIPKQPNSLHFRSDHWPVVAGAMHLLATTGISMRFELQDILASQRGIAPRSGSLRRIFEKDLLDEELIVTEPSPPSAGTVWPWCSSQTRARISAGALAGP